jgi:aspartyl/asparaginyl beta-hydroxylase (cupin superfamily)
MNLKLVESLATIIDSLSSEEKQILQRKIQEIKQEKQEIKSGKHSLDEFINITRDERTAAQDELIYNCFIGEEK